MKRNRSASEGKVAKYLHTEYKMTLPQDFDLKAELKKCKTPEDLTRLSIFLCK